MIRPPGIGGAAFSEAAEGDLRDDPEARTRFSDALGVSRSWATVRQVHGSNVVRADVPTSRGEADAIWTTVVGLPVAVFTADCYGVVLQAPGAVGVAHAGWRGAAEGVVGKLRREMTARGHAPITAALGPGIGACCFEVGEEVATLFPDYRETTTWGTASVDLIGSISADLVGLEVWVSGGCTYHEPGWFSHRQTGTEHRLAAIGWLP